jgi:hypothetical protein
MADIERSSTAVWTGDLPGGEGTMSTASAVLKDEEYTFATRFKNAPGTNPEELKVERQLEIEVDEVLHFSQGPHNDEPE